MRLNASSSPSNYPGLNVKEYAMRISSKQYREWTIEEWCEHVLALRVNRLSDWASVSRSSYNHAVTLGRQREVARKLGWLPKLDSGEMQQMSDDEFVERFHSKGVRSMTDLWKSAQHWCEFLRREGRLEAVAEKLGFGYVVEWHPADDVNYYLERCGRVGDFKVWCQLDKNAAEAARKHGLMDEVRKRAPRRPRKGYPTAGGNCKSLPELAVARLFEANEVDFVTSMDYPFTFPRGSRQCCKTDFYLTRLGAFIEVWSVISDDDSYFWKEYQLRRRFKTDMCNRLNLRLLNIEGQILFRQGPEVYLGHISAVLSMAGVQLDVGLDRWAAFNPKYVTKVGCDGK
jgi:hypothetical protein